MEDKKNVMSSFLWLKVRSRSLVSKAVMLQDEIARLGRKKRLLVSRQSPFDRSRIAMLVGDVKLLMDALDCVNVSLSRLGCQIVQQCRFVDEYLTLREQSHLVGRSHFFVEKTVSSIQRSCACQPIHFLDLIFAIGIEYRGKGNVFPLYDVSMPFRCAVFWFMKQQFVENRDFRETLDAELDGLFLHGV